MAQLLGHVGSLSTPLPDRIKRRAQSLFHVIKDGPVVGGPGVLAKGNVAKAHHQLRLRIRRDADQGPEDRLKECRPLRWNGVNQ